MRPAPTRPTHRRRPVARAAALVMAGSLALAACGQADEADPAAGADDDATTASGGEATIRYSWWGGSDRSDINHALIDAFEAENPDITVVPDFTDWSGYWDKMATQTAGGDTSDVMMQEERYLREYAERGVLANLADYDVDTSGIDESLLASGEFDDGLWGIPTGVNVRVMLTNRQVFEEAGVEMPDDTTWTWDDYHDLMVQITQNTPDGTYGAEQFGFIESDLGIWLRQHGQNLWDENGEIGFEPELLAEFWERSLALIADGGAPPVSEGLEQRNAGIEQTLVGTNRAAIIPGWTNTVEPMSVAAGGDVVPLRFPGETEFDRTGHFLKPAMSIAMSADSEYPEAAAAFVDWMVNSPEAGEIILSDRGLPANLDVREHITDQLSETEQMVAEFVEEVTEDIVDAAPAPPTGAGQVADLLGRYNEEVLFGLIKPQDAADRFVEEVATITG
ncbi:extracellular solute-binding protein [Cellulomonas sp. ATA003]|uniref:ABC transporter substrate-binding protein n=1 Tax=Cellulomonas sp. ATA003 TaxID=3073064 RepID=UPI0028739478|nr:extracellular solute-binding protein [Cellulomonas sp. ATA003]WNB86706.1 extracellular solute-binding protein [Cellulomonas sp. ATA003]